MGTFYNGSDVVHAMGISKSKEEASENWSAALAADISDNWSMAVDYYSIEIDDRIAISNPLAADDDLINAITGTLTNSLRDSGAVVANR